MSAREDSPGPPRPISDPAARAVLDYHLRTRHHLHAYARSLGYLDWANQPDPFLRFEGAPLLSLPEVAPCPVPLWDDLLESPEAAPVRSMGREGVADLLYHSMALSAWKEIPGARWSLRVNPSSGNLHPTEAYVLAPAVPGLAEEPALYHYAPHEHGLELRRRLGTWPEDAPEGALLVGLTSIPWREAWKYGERAFRYCHHDVGHALAAVALAATMLGWRARWVGGAPDALLARLLGAEDAPAREAEHPDLLLALGPRDAPTWEPTGGDLEALARGPLLGSRRALSEDHHPWPVVEEVAAASARVNALRPEAEAEAPAPSGRRGAEPARGLGARGLVRQRRSAVALDGETRLSRPGFERILARTLPVPGRAPFAALPWGPRVHLALLVHRVDGLAPGLYLLLRDPDARDRVRGALDPTFTWADAGEGLPEGCLLLLREGDVRGAARRVSCHQDIASDGAAAFAMLADLDAILEARGAWAYRALHWEAGAIGQVLYLEAEAAGVRGTGIGCFFDEEMHRELGCGGSGLRTLYHFTLGGPVHDGRLRTLPAYAHLGMSLT